MHKILIKNANFLSFQCLKISAFYFSNFEKYWKIKKNFIVKPNFTENFSVFQFQWRFQSFSHTQKIEGNKNSDNFFKTIYTLTLIISTLMFILAEN